MTANKDAAEKTDRNEKAAKFFAREVQNARLQLDAFAAKITAPDRDPAQVLGEAGDAFADAAKLHAATVLGQLVAQKGTIAALRFATERAMGTARFPERSSSPTANLIAADRGAAYARYAEYLVELN